VCRQRLNSRIGGGLLAGLGFNEGEEVPHTGSIAVQSKPLQEGSLANLSG